MNIDKATRRDNRKSRRIKHQHVSNDIDKKDKHSDWKKARKQKEELLKLVLDNNE